MTALVNGIWKLKIWNETRGQDLMEFALMGGFVALVAAALFPSISDGVCLVFKKVLGTLALSSATAVGPSN